MWYWSLPYSGSCSVWCLDFPVRKQFSKPSYGGKRWTKEPCHWSGGTDHNMEQKHWVWCFTSFFYTIRAILALKLIFFSSHFKKLVLLPCIACLGLKTVQGTGWTLEMLRWSFRFLSYMTIWKQSTQIINSFSKSAFIKQTQKPVWCNQR